MANKSKEEVKLLPQEAQWNAKPNDRGRYWYILAWKDSIDKDWEKILKNTGVVFVAICHDRDVDYTTGEKIKPHYHIFLAMSGNMNRSAMIKYRDMINGTSLLLRENKRKSIDYLTHEDAPEKAQYEKEELILGNISKEEFEKKLLQEEKKDTLPLFKKILSMFKKYDIKIMPQLYDLLDSDKTGLNEKEREELYAYAYRDQSRLNSILASINGIKKNELQKEEIIKEVLMVLKEEKKQEEKKKVVYVEEPTDEEYAREMAEEFGEIVKKPKQEESIMAGFMEEDIMAGFRELEEQEKNKK